MPGVWGAAAPQKNQAEHFLVFFGPNARFKLQILLSRRFVQWGGEVPHLFEPVLKSF